MQQALIDLGDYSAYTQDELDVLTSTVGNVTVSADVAGNAFYVGWAITPDTNGGYTAEVTRGLPVTINGTAAPFLAGAPLDSVVVEVLDERLADRQFVADQLSVADIAIWTWVSRWKFQQVDIDDFPSVRRWYVELAGRPAFQRGYSVPAEESVPLP